MVFRIFLRQIDLGSLLMVAAKSIILAIIFPAATSLTMVIRTLDFPATSTKLFGYFALICWCCYSCLYGFYFNGCTRVRSLVIAA
jgi:hypothetical protein